MKDVSMQDYKRRQLNKITYSPIFWRYIEEPETFYGFSVKIPEDQYPVWEKLYRANYERDLIYSYELMNKMFQKINSLQNTHKYNIYIYFARIKVAYYKTYRIRWNYKHETRN